MKCRQGDREKKIEGEEENGGGEGNGQRIKETGKVCEREGERWRQGGSNREKEIEGGKESEQGRNRHTKGDLSKLEQTESGAVAPGFSLSF